jgi:hypothetical protein
MLLVLPISDGSDKVFGIRLSVATLEGVVAIIVESTKLEADEFKIFEADVPRDGFSWRNS